MLETKDRRKNTFNPLYFTLTASVACGVAPLFIHGTNGGKSILLYFILAAIGSLSLFILMYIGLRYKKFAARLILSLFFACLPPLIVLSVFYIFNSNG